MNGGVVVAIKNLLRIFVFVFVVCAIAIPSLADARGRRKGRHSYSYGGGGYSTAAKIATPHNPAIIYKPGDGVVSSGLAYVAVRACQAVVC